VEKLFGDLIEGPYTKD